MAKKRFNIFVSYRHCDDEGGFVTGLVERLEEELGTDSVFIDRSNLGAGRFPEELRKAVEDSHCFMPILTKAYVDIDSSSGWCFHEALCALKSGIHIAPIAMEGYDSDIGCLEASTAYRIIAPDDGGMTASDGFDIDGIEEDDCLHIVRNLQSYSAQYESATEIRIAGEAGTTKGIDPNTVDVDRLLGLVFDSAVRAEHFDYYREFLAGQEERLDRLPSLGKVAAGRDLTVSGTFFEPTVLRHWTEKETEERRKEEKSTAPVRVRVDELCRQVVSNRYSVITAVSGQGKSMLLRKLCIEMGREASDGHLPKGCVIPVFAECRAVVDGMKRGDAPDSDLVAVLADRSKLNRKALEVLVARKSVILMLDAMDEVSPDAMDRLKENIEKRLPGIPIIFTSRPSQRLISGRGEMKIGGQVVRRYTIDLMDGSQREDFTAKLGQAKEADRALLEEFRGAIADREEGDPAYAEISANPFMTMAALDVYLDGRELPKTRIETMKKMVDLIIDRDVAKDDTGAFKTRVLALLGKVAVDAYKAKDANAPFAFDADKAVELAASLFGWNDGKNCKEMEETEDFFSRHSLVDRHGNFPHDFIANYCAARHLDGKIRKLAGRERPLSDLPEKKELASGTPYWNGVVETLLCLIDLEGKDADSREILEPVLDMMQEPPVTDCLEGCKPDYDLLCGTVSMLVYHKPRASANLVGHMLERGIDGIITGHVGKGGIYAFDKGENPYEELFYYVATYPYLREYARSVSIPDATTVPDRAAVAARLLHDLARINDLSPDVVRPRIKKRYRRLLKTASSGERKGRSDDLKGAVILLEGVAAIGECAFRGCTGLTGITIPASVAAIGGWAFYGCTGLERVEIPEGVAAIGECAFEGCTGLTSIRVLEGNPRYRSEGECLIEAGTSVLVAGCKASIIPASVAAIGDSAFKGCTGLERVEIPEGVATIGDSAFRGCTGLKRVSIPKRFKHRFHKIFHSCFIEPDNIVFT